MNNQLPTSELWPADGAFDVRRLRTLFDPLNQDFPHPPFVHRVGRQS